MGQMHADIFIRQVKFMNVLKQLENFDIWEYDSDDFSNYVALIEGRLQNHNIDGYSECHHIIPRCVYLSLGEDVVDSPDNLIRLTMAEHILAHYYLCGCVKIEKYPTIHAKLCQAFFMMTHEKYQYCELDKLLEKMPMIE